MNFLTGFAVFFIIWWVTLFAVLPMGVRTQAEESDIAPGTTESAPHTLNMTRKLLLTTAISAAIFAVYYVATVSFGFSVDSLPRIVPDFSSR